MNTSLFSNTDDYHARILTVEAFCKMPLQKMICSMAKKNVSMLTFVLMVSLAFSQSLIPRVTGSLPASLYESSGLENGPDRTLWTHNDSGNEPIIYQIDSTGKILREVRLANAANIDWEDVAQDDRGNLYVGDVGNNSNARRNLAIYRISAIDLALSDTVSVDTIRFSYADQRAFPPANNELNYDVEAIFWVNDSIHIFTKNRTSPFNGWVYHYMLPDQPGSYVITKVDSFNTGGAQKENFWITAADVSDDGKKMVLLSSDKMWIFSCYLEQDYLKGFGLRVGLGSLTQKEAIAFVGGTRLMLTDEQFIITGGRVYDLDIRGLPDMQVDLGLDRMLAGDSITLNPTMPSATRFRWSTGDTTNFLNVDTPGEYSVEVSLNGCTASDTVLVLGPDSRIEMAPPLEVKIGPNPFAQDIQVSLELPVAGPVELSLIDSAGKVAFRDRQLFTEKGEHRISMQPHGLAPGVYQLILRQNEYRVSGKIVKE